MPIQAKLCGLTDAAAVDAASAGGAAFVGFVFFPPSPRDIAPGRAGALATPAHIGRIGVFVDPDDDLLARAIREARLTGVQLHGDEPPARAAAIRARHGVEVWKAVPVRTAADLAAARRYRGAATRILYDARTPPGTLPGGMGLRFDWALLEGVDHPLPWALSGGIDAGNVADAVGATGARLVDVSSGIEDAPGAKSVDKITAFLQAIGRL